MKNEFIIRFSGEQGSGVQLTGQLCAAYFSQCGYFVFGVNEFESRIRGGYSFTQLSISTKRTSSITKAPDIVIPYSKFSLSQDEKTISNDTVIIAEKGLYEGKTKGCLLWEIDFDALMEKGDKAYKNIFYLSLIAGLFDTDKDILNQAIKKAFSKKGPDIIGKNLSVSEAGYRYKANFPLPDLHIENIPTGKKDTAAACSGSYALSLGALISNCKFYSAYPMSPSTSIMNHLSQVAESAGIVIEQAEDEIAALNMALGASYAGIRSMTGTSGGGMALMSETVSLAAISEVPIVIVNAQRPAPATGLPTRTEQADLLFTLYMGHGEFTRIILAPGTHEKAFELIQKGFYLADKYQVPVFILTDQYLMDSISTQEKWPCRDEWQKRFIDEEEKENLPYLRYGFTKTGVSPRKIPGGTHHPVIADSHTHEESGYITEDHELRKKGVEKLLIKEKHILGEMADPCFSEEGPKINLVIGWGSTFGVIKDAVDILAKKNYSLCHVHFHEVYPLQTAKLKKLLTPKTNIICVENNATGQFAQLLKQKSDIIVNENIVKYDGRPFYRDELVSRLEGVLKIE